MITRNPEATKRRIEYSRLPEIARIVRNVFIAEKKTVLLKTALLTKLTSSYREILTSSKFIFCFIKISLLKLLSAFLRMVDRC